MLSTSGLIGTGKKNPELYSTLSKVDRSRTIEGASDFSKFVKTHGPNTRTTSKNSISDRSMSIALDTHGNPVDKKVIVRGCCGNLRAIFGGFRGQYHQVLMLLRYGGSSPYRQDQGRFQASAIPSLAAAALQRSDMAADGCRVLPMTADGCRGPPMATNGSQGLPMAAEGCRELPRTTR